MLGFTRNDRRKKKTRTIVDSRRVTMLFRAFWPLVAISVFLGSSVAQPRAGAAEPNFQGPKVCQDCHKTEYETWEGTKHFKSFRTVHKADNAKYKAVQEQRVADAAAALSALIGVPEAQALVAEPTEENARALVVAIADKDLSGEVAGLLPDPSTYK